MKWWFNKYLPSQLLQTFPELEGSVDVDNPVVGVGCQSIYDPNNDIVYFCKKDYAVKEEFKACIDYNPTTGFGINQTCQNGVSQVPTCPDGYTLNSNGMCEKISYEPDFYLSHIFLCITHTLKCEWRYQNPMHIHYKLYNRKLAL